MEYLHLIWLGLFMIFIIIEILTLKVLAIWFAGGTFFAFVLALFGISFIIQIPAFILLSMILLISRPCLKRFLDNKNTKTVDELESEEI